MCGLAISFRGLPPRSSPGGTSAHRRPLEADPLEPGGGGPSPREKLQRAALQDPSLRGRLLHRQGVAWEKSLPNGETAVGHEKLAGPLAIESRIIVNEATRAKLDTTWLECYPVGVPRVTQGGPGSALSRHETMRVYPAERLHPGGHPRLDFSCES